jgi:hypothetical protein
MSHAHYGCPRALYRWLALTRRGGWNAGRIWGKKGETPIVSTPIVSTTGARYAMSLISVITSQGRMRFMVKATGGVNADVFIEFLKRLLVGETRKIFLIVDRDPAHREKKTNVVSSLRSLQRKPEKICSFVQKPSLRYAA